MAFQLIHFVIIFKLLSVSDSTFESNKDHVFYTCVDRFGSNASGCSLSATCCSTVTALVLDLNKQCTSLPMSQSRQVVIDIKSDLILNDTVHFGAICNESIPIEIKGKNSVINCFNNIQQVRKDEGQGLCFISVQSLSIMNLTFLNCGSLQSSTSKNVSHHGSTYLFPTTIYFLNCSNVSLTNITISHSAGTGIALFDTVGDVSIVNCSFEDNRMRKPLAQAYPGGGGLYIEFTKCTPGYLGNCRHDNSTAAEASYYLISRCSFKSNYASLLDTSSASYIKSSMSFQGFGKGGGIALYINGYSISHSIIITNCTFFNNSAVFGGGIFVQFRDSPINISLIVKGNNFKNNSCYLYGGGGVSLGFVIRDQDSNEVIQNTVSFIDCIFEENSAKGNGGGLSIFSTKGVSTKFRVTNVINLVNCQWRSNHAFVASAVDIAPEVYSRLGIGLLPKIVIDNCTFEYNCVHNKDIVKPTSNYFNASINGLATVYISGFQVDFKRNICFQYNDDTGIYLTSASIAIKEGSNILFEGNIGKHGGAITIAAFSVIYIENHSSISFVNNTSLTKGGAILVLYSDTQHEAGFSHSCFIQHNDSQNSSGIEFFFTGNTARSKVGNVLFAATLRPCTQNATNPFAKIGKVYPPQFEQLDIASPVINFSIDSKDNLNHIIPGSEIILNISAIDELNQTHKYDVVYEAFMKNATPSNSITIDPAYTQVSKNAIKFLGNISQSVGILQLETERASLSINISLNECPPGFLNTGKSCECSESVSKYEGISSCVGNRSLLVRGFWIGQCKNDTICTGRCPHGYCPYGGSISERVELPSRMSDLDRFMCGKYRTGILCSNCRNGSSVYYHSHSYRCQPNKLCNYGILFYIISEIIPLSIVFLLVMIFNISLTSGAVNGFVLFAQVADSIDISAQGSIEFTTIIKKLSFPYRLIYRLFNFDFFSLESLSFCFWESATTLDMMVVKFATIVYALFLIFFTVFILNSWKCKMLCAWFRPRTLRAALTHGLTTLLVICVSQCARISSLILAPTLLTYPDHNVVVVLYNAGLHPFHKGHLQYAIPALFFVILLVVLPIVWLLMYPLLFMMLAKCHLSESKLSQFLTKLFPIEILDSFQSCFKDNCRHFAGLYFLYRLAPLVTIANSHITFYTLTTIEFLFMFVLHSVFQPYKHTFHNRIDSLIFTDLLLINLLTAYNYGMITSVDHFPKEIKFIVIHVQLVLMYLPLVYISCVFMMKIFEKLKRHYSGYIKIKANFEDSSSLPQLRDVTESNHNF